ncbi:MAG: glutamate--tRNA ligase family protein [Candidatus Hodgkinia cicadicola]|nr:MAG: glutamate--tRNA ligase family protein [Candidatus Hodgkinia cicadicola]
MVRVRIAPSPTGCLHLGNLLVGVFNMLFKLKHGARLILRLEDTDTARSFGDCAPKVYDAFNMVGLVFDESPLDCGKFGPYIQTQRRHIYSCYCKLLVASGSAFWCKCRWQRTNALKRVNLALGQASVYDGRCLKSQVRGSYGCLKLRLKVPRAGVFASSECAVAWKQVEMQPLWVRGEAVFHLASVVDDHLMRVSHVLRGRDWLASFAKHSLLYVYLVFSVPKVIHLPLLALGGGTKLSKRLVAGGVSAYSNLGVVPEAILTYLACLAVGEQVASLEDAVQRFNLQCCRRQSVRVDHKRLFGINRRLLASASITCFSLFGLALGKHKVNKALALCVEKASLLADVYRLMSFAFCSSFDLVAWGSRSSSYAVLAVLVREHKRLAVWTKPALMALHTKISAKLGMSLRSVLVLMYVVAFGTRDSISLYDSFVILGKDAVVFRLSLSLNQLST